MAELSKSEPTEVLTAHQRAAGVTIPWAWLSAGLGTTAIGALGTLAVVVGINNVDTLSTIALALAVLAFAAQLIVSLAQGMAGAQQVAQVERVNANTQSALASLRATSDALLATQREQFAQVLSVALRQAVPEAVSETIADGIDGSANELGASQSVQLQEAILSRVEDLLRRPQPLSRSSLPQPILPAARPEPTLRYHELNRFPEEARGRELAEVLRNLTPWETQVFTRKAILSKHRALNGLPTGSPVVREYIGPGNRGLLAKDLIRVEDPRVDRHSSDLHVWVDLTDFGIELASLIVAGGDMPKWLKDEMDTG